MTAALQSHALRLGAEVYFRGLRALGVPRLRRRFEDAGLVLCYHNVVDTKEVALGDVGLHVPRDRFERHMAWLVERYDVVSLRDFVDRLASGASLRSTAAVTFDDGYAGVFEHAVPTLTAMAIPSTVFVVAEAVGTSAAFPWDDDAPHPPADWTTIRAAMRHGVEIGAHSLTHPSLPAIADDAQLEGEIAGSRAIIHRATGVQPEFFAYPFGHWNARTRDVVEAAGYRAGFTLDYGLNGAAADPWALRRVNVPAGISERQLETWAGGFHRLRRAG